MNNQKIKALVLIALFSAIIVICSLITIPAAIPFTLQTFGVFLCFCVLGAKKGLASVIIYVLLGIIGLPVFSGFNGGIGALLNVSGGYIFGFIFSALVFWLIDSLLIKKPRKVAKTLSSFVGLIVCYFFGTLWYILFFARNGEAIPVTTAIAVCVLPFIIPDILKIALAISISEKIKM